MTVRIKATIRKKGLHWDAEVDEAEIAKLVSDGGLKPETLARRKRVRAAFQAFSQRKLPKNN